MVMGHWSTLLWEYQAQVNMSLTRVQLGQIVKVMYFLNQRDLLWLQHKKHQDQGHFLYLMNGINQLLLQVAGQNLIYQSQ